MKNMNSKHVLKIAALSAMTLCGGQALANESVSQVLGVDAETQQLTVNINTADPETLSDLLNGIGKSRAMAIIEYRERNGAFKNAAELVAVKGIGPSILERNRSVIRVE